MDIAPIALLGTGVIVIAHLLDGMSQQNHFFAVNGSCSIATFFFTGGQSFFQDYWGCIPMVNRAPWCPVTLPAAANYHDNPAMGLIGRQVGLAI